jgi:hypothetical protein
MTEMSALLFVIRSCLTSVSRDVLRLFLIRFMLWTANDGRLTIDMFLHVVLYFYATSDLKSGVFWDVAPCGSCKNRRFGGTWLLLHQGDKLAYVDC